MLVPCRGVTVPLRAKADKVCFSPFCGSIRPDAVTARRSGAETAPGMPVPTSRTAL